MRELDDTLTRSENETERKQPNMTDECAPNLQRQKPPLNEPHGPARNREPPTFIATVG